MPTDTPFVLEMLIQDTDLMSVDMLVTDDPISLDIAESFDTQMTLEIGNSEGILLELVDGSIKGDKGDPGGVTTIKVSGQDLGGHRVVMLATNGFIYYASSFTENHYNKILGITTQASTAGANTIIQIMDVMEEGSWDWTPDLPVFLGDNGLLTQNEEDTGIFILQIGVALTATKIYIDKQFPLFK